MKSKCSLLSVQPRLLSLSELTLRAEPWLPETLCVSWPSPGNVCAPAGREHYPNHRHTHPPLIRRPIPYVSSFLGEQGEKWRVRGIFFAGPSFLVFQRPQQLSNLTRAQPKTSLKSCATCHRQCQLRGVSDLLLLGKWP